MPTGLKSHQSSLQLKLKNFDTVPKYFISIADRASFMCGRKFKEKKHNKKNPNQISGYSFSQAKDSSELANASVIEPIENCLQPALQYFTNATVLQ